MYDHNSSIITLVLFWQISILAFAKQKVSVCPHILSFVSTSNMEEGGEVNAAADAALVDLPEEMVEHVCTFLPAQDVKSLEETCKRMRAATSR